MGRFGFGLIDATKLVDAARSWKPRGVFDNVQTPLRLVNKPIPFNDEGIVDRMYVSAAMIENSLLQSRKSLLARPQTSSPSPQRQSTGQSTQQKSTMAQLALEQVTVTVNIKHQRRGDLEVYLTSPSNTTSQLSTQRRMDHSNEGLLNWTFMTVMFYGEEAAGDWTIRVVDRVNPEYLNLILY